MKTRDDNGQVDWRARLHSLGDMEPASMAGIWLRRAIPCLGLFLGGLVFVVMSGAMFGLSRGIGPEHTGGAAYILPGLIFNLIAGAVIAAFVARCSVSLTVPRLVFYSFSAPAFLAVAFMAFSMARQMPKAAQQRVGADLNSTPPSAAPAIRR